MRRAWITALRPTADPGSAPPPACSPRTLEQAEAVLGKAAVGWAIEAALAINDEVEAAARADSRLPLTGLELPACEAGLLTVLRLVRLERDTDVGAPEEAVEQVRLAVRQGTPIDSGRYVTRLTAAAGARRAAVLDNPDGSIGVLWSFPRARRAG